MYDEEKKYAWYVFFNQETGNAVKQTLSLWRKLSTFTINIASG